MEKFIVRCYYEYCACVEVEANNAEEAFEAGFELCDKMSTGDLDFVGYVSSEVQDDTGFIQEF